MTPWGSRSADRLSNRQELVIMRCHDLSYLEKCINLLNYFNFSAGDIRCLSPAGGRGLLRHFVIGLFTAEKSKKEGEAEELSVGDGILSHIVSNAVPSALAGLTSGFGMDPGVPPRL